MRPIELTIQGLHSFRQKVTIDFATLCQGGVFGIFGPTGSGKSSILDAMTLSLYGRVDRATTHTYSIINQAENELEVTFTFSLKENNRTITYKVERAMKKTKDQKTQTTVCRLIDVAKKQSPVVIADKTTAVNEKIKQILGLSIDDFTRAVVLPQNKFSEFLKLRGADRRKMLQRLFHLEKYGDELIEKIRLRLQHATFEQEKIMAEQQGLGDVSREHLQEIKEKEARYDEEWKILQQQQEELEKAWNRGKEIRAWQHEKKIATEKLRLLKEKEEEIRQGIATLKRSEEAEQLLPFARAYLETKKEVDSSERKKEEAIARYEEKKRTYDLFYEEWQQFEQEKEKQLPLLEEALRTIEKVKELEDEQAADTNRFQQVKEKRQSIQDEKEAITKRYNKLENNVKIYTEKLAELKEEQLQRKVSLKEKQKVYEAVERKYRLDERTSQWHEWNNETEKRYKKITEIEAQKQQLLEKQTAYKNKLEQRFTQLMYWYNKANDDYQWLERSLSQLEQRLEEMQLEEMAAQLRMTLKSGEPCLVCGSTTHDFSAHEKKKRTEKKERLIFTELKNNATKVKTRLQKRMWKLEQTSQLLSPFTNEVAATAEERVFPEVDELTTETWTTLEKTWDKEEETITHLLRQLEEERKMFEQLSETIQKRRYDIEVERKQYEEAKEKKTNLHQQLEKERAEWHNDFPDFSLETIAARKKEIEEKEKKWEQLARRIEKGTTVIEKEKLALEQQREQIQQLLTNEARIEQEYKQMEDSLKERKQKIAQLLGEKSFEQFTYETERKQLEIKEKEREWKERLDKQLQEKTTAEKEMHIAFHAYDDAKKRWEKAKDHWNEKKNNDFQPEEVLLYILPSSEKEKLQQTIIEYDKEIHHWQEKEKEMEKKLAGLSISEEEWEQTTNERENLSKQLDEIREKRSIVKEQLRQIEEKRHRFTELEKERKKWDKLKGQLEKLDRVFRGKAFVEFLAEEQLLQVSKTATEHLQLLTRGRYGIEVDSQGGFIIRDDANAGIRRPVSSLSGGETFLTSLALSLALSTSIQLKGKYPLEFFFLDEGFGTLDNELLDTVMTALENLQTKNISVGIISHVPELKDRLSRKLFVTPAEPGGKGSTVRFAPL